MSEKLGFKTKPADIVFHRDIFIPKELVEYLSGQRIQIYPSAHVEKEKIDKEYMKTDIYVPPSYFYKVVEVNPNSIIEVGISWDGDLQHLLLRYPYNEEWDIILAISYPSGKVKTFWFNRRGDIHRTLEKGYYTYPEQWARLKSRVRIGA